MTLHTRKPGAAPWHGEGRSLWLCTCGELHGDRHFSRPLVEVLRLTGDHCQPYGAPLGTSLEGWAGALHVLYSTGSRWRYYQLTDYLVSSHVGGPAVVLVPRDGTDHAATVATLARLPVWAPLTAETAEVILSALEGGRP